MKLTFESKKLVTELIKEFQRTDYVFGTKPKEYFNEVEGLIFASINPPEDLALEMHGKLENKTPCYYQLHHSKTSLELIKKLAHLISKTNSIQCIPTELIPTMEAIIYEYINYDFECYILYPELRNEQSDIDFKKVMDIGLKRISMFKSKISSHEFRFPVTVFNLEKEVKLSKNISLLPITNNDSVDVELSDLKETRLYDTNYWLEIQVEKKCTKAFAFQLAEKARDTTFNLLRLLAARLSPNAIPLLSSSDERRHRFDFHMHSTGVGDFQKNTTHYFSNIHSYSKNFWDGFFEGKEFANNVIDISMTIPELLLSKETSKPRVVEHIERSLVWYGDAVTEQNSQQQIQKLVISLEALVNFKEDNTTKIFCNRVSNLNILHSGVNNIALDKASKIYAARSKIIHGSSTSECLDFCAVDFCSETLLRAIYYLSLFGFEKTGFKKSMPAFLDEIPNRAILNNN